jgi:hypothetical protein
MRRLLLPIIAVAIVIVALTVSLGQYLEMQSRQEHIRCQWIAYISKYPVRDTGDACYVKVDTDIEIDVLGIGSETALQAWLNRCCN